MHELSVTTFIDAAPARVWDIMTNRQNEWFCPAPWRAEVVTQERWPGGKSSITMHGPDGEVMPNEGVFLAWDEGRRFVTTDAFDTDFQPQGPFMIGIWEIEPEGDGTRFTATARHWTEEAKNQHDSMGFQEGWGGMQQQLKDLCEQD